MKFEKGTHNLFTKFQQNCQKAVEKPFDQGALSPMKLDRATKTSLEKEDSRTQESRKGKEEKSSPLIVGL